MIAMQYKITLPNDYDMDVIKRRVSENGHKTDGFSDLLFKAYLIADYPTKKQYSPFYMWNKQDGINKFIFDGFYDNILCSFGWQSINIAIPLQIDITNKFSESSFVLEIEHEILSSNKMNKPVLSMPNKVCLGKILVYNPDKWKYVEFYFFDTVSDEIRKLGNVYEVLHVSM